MKKQTAVQSFWDNIALKLSFEQLKEFIPELKKAKEMEKEQILEFTNSFYDECVMQCGSLNQSAEEYYEETFNTKEKCLSCDCKKQDYVLYCEFCRQQI